MKKVVKKPRGYAAPEMYEHLRPLNDLLVKGQFREFSKGSCIWCVKEGENWNLQSQHSSPLVVVVFCGIK